MKKKSNTIRINKFVIICVIFLFVAIIIKLGYVNLANKIDNVDLAEFAENMKATRKELYADRGYIYDANGEVLAKNANAYNVVAFLEESRTTNPKNPQHVVDKQMTAEKLSEVLLPLNEKMTVEYILSLLNKDAYQVQLGPGGNDILELTKNKIQKLNLPGIGFIASTKRYYPQSTIAPYIVGYAKKNDKGEIVGEMGIESYFNDTLKGIKGYTEYQKDIYGYQIPNTPSYTEESIPGQDIYLTIDPSIQLMVESTISDLQKNNKMDWMQITIANAKTGAILASGTNRSFNLNNLDTLEYHTDPLVSYQYEPGSTMKIFSFMAAMEYGKYDGDALYDSGTIKIGKETISDPNDVGWGRISYDTGFVYSSNTAATRLARAVGKENLRNYYKSLGFGSPTGIELPKEVSGQIGFNYEIEVATASFGQGITVTPIQNIQAMTAIANNGMMLKPYIVEKVVNARGEVTYQGGRQEIGRVASKETTDKMRELMYEVVFSGKTAARSYQTAYTTLIGKTGTAEIPAPGGGYLTGENDTIRSFLGMFPYEEPEYIIYISTKQNNATYKVLANKVAELADAIAKNDSKPDEENIIVNEDKTINLTNYINKDAEITKENLIELGLKPIVIGEGNIVVNQYPLKGKNVLVDSKVFILTGKLEITMPDVIGWSENEIVTFCNLIGLKYRTEDYGIVYETNIDKNSKIDLNGEMVIKLKK